MKGIWKKFLIINFFDDKKIINFFNKRININIRLDIINTKKDIIEEWIKRMN